MDKNLYILAGCNGVGKTTASFTILLKILKCSEFVNADEIAVGLSPFQPEKAVVEAGKIMLGRIEHLLQENSSFAFETSLSPRIHKNTVLKAKAMGYNITLLFFWLQTVELAKKRVEKRVSEGGHNIEEAVIERRYINGIRNLFDIYLPIVDAALIFDNSEGKHELIAEKSDNLNITIINNPKYNNLLKYYDNTRKSRNEM